MAFNTKGGCLLLAHILSLSDAGQKNNQYNLRPVLNGGEIEKDRPTARAKRYSQGAVDGTDNN